MKLCRVGTAITDLINLENYQSFVSVPNSRIGIPPKVFAWFESTGVKGTARRTTLINHRSQGQ
jgi:hypothetical protein